MAAQHLHALAAGLGLVATLFAAPGVRADSAADTPEALRLACLHAASGEPSASSSRAAVAAVAGHAQAIAHHYDKGVLALAAACSPILRWGADLAEVPRPTARRALAAFARLLSQEPRASELQFVQQRFAALDDGPPNGKSPDAELAAWRWQMRVEQAILLTMLARDEEALAAFAALDAESSSRPRDPTTDRLMLRASRFHALATMGAPDAPRALAMMASALERSEALLGPDAVETVLARSMQGNLLWRAGQLREAEMAYAAAAAGAERTLGSDHLHTLNARQAQAYTMLWRGQFGPALTLFESARAAALASLGPDEPDLMYLDLNRSYALALTGDLEQAESLLVDLRERYARRRGADDEQTLEASTRLSLVRYWLGDGVGALRAAEVALLARAQRAPPHDSSRLADESAYASALQLLGRTSEAVTRLQRAMAIGLPVHGVGQPVMLTLHIDLAFALVDAGRDGEAMTVLQRLESAFAAGSAAEADYPQQRLLGQQLLVELQLRAGQTGPALALARSAREQRRAVLGADNPLTRSIDVLLARAELATALAAGTAAPESALHTLRTLVGQLRDAPGAFWRDLFSARAALAQAADAQHALDAAIQERRSFVRDVERIRERLDDSPGTRQAYLRQWIPEYKRLARDLVRAGDLPAGFAMAEQARSRTLVETLASRMADEGGPSRAADRAALARLAGRLAALDDAAQAAAGDATAAIEAERARAADALAQERTQVAARDPRYAALRATPLVPSAQARRWLRAGDLYVAYTVLEQELLITSVDGAGSVGGMVVPIAGSLRDAIEGWRALLAGTARTPLWIDGQSVTLGVLRPGANARRVHTADEVGAVLARLLLAPVLQVPGASGTAHAGTRRHGATRRLIVAADPMLALLPFDALPWQGRPLIASVVIAHVQSLGVLALLAGQQGHWQGTSRDAALVVGDPDFEPHPDAHSPTADAASSGGSARAPQGGPLDSDGPVPGSVRAADGRVVWQRLPGTRIEARTIAQRHAGASLLLDREATEDAVLLRFGVQGRRLSLLHLATHGFISRSRPWGSAVVLATPRAGDRQDGYLTAAEFARHAIRARLVVLSACDTAGGNALEGEGVLGFPYALLAAGSGSTLLTLRPVADHVMARFMPQVLALVRGGLPPSRALAVVKRQWLKAHDERANPAWWSGTVVYGL